MAERAQEMRSAAAPATNPVARDPALARLVPAVIEDLKPVAVWLFGSRAEGRARQDSDYDLLVVLPDDAPPAAFGVLRAWAITDRVRVKADVVTCTQSDFEDERDLPGTIAKAASQRGVLLYER